MTTLTIGQHRNKTFIIDVVDADGVPVNISGANEITVVIAAAIDGAIHITKTLTGGGVTIGTDTQYSFKITDADWSSLTLGTLYWECMIENSSGDDGDGGSGDFVVQDRRIGDP